MVLIAKQNHRPAAPGRPAGAGPPASPDPVAPPAPHAGPLPGSPGALERLEARLGLARFQARVGDSILLLPEPADPVAYVQTRVAPGHDDLPDLPYWTKLWPAALVLAGLAAGLAPPKGADPDEPILELGAGLGLPGLAAAAQGRRVILSDLDPDALEFARAAVELNHLEDRVEVRALDWTVPPADLGRFHTVLGAEILYHRPLYPHLARLLARVLAPGGTAFLSHEQRPFNISFFGMLGEEFEQRSTLRRVRGEDGETLVVLHALKRAGQEA